MLLVAVAAAEPPPPVAQGVPPTAKSAWIVPLETRGAVVWFTEEARLVEAALATEMTRRGYAVAPVARQHAAIDRMTSGQLPDREGACRAMPPASRWLEQDYGKHHRITSNLTCEDETCRLSVKVFPPGEPGSLERLTLVLPASVTPRAAAAAVSKLRPEPPEVGFGGLFGALGGGYPTEQFPVHAQDLEIVGGWGAIADLDTRLTPLHERLAACTAPDEAWLDLDARTNLRLAVGADGRVTRCEPANRTHLAPGVACQCEVLDADLVFDKGAADRRLAMSLQVAPLHVEPYGAPDPLDRTIALDATAATDPTALLGRDFLVDRALRACLSRPMPEQRWPLTMDVAADGRVTRVSVGLPLDGGDPATAACVERALTGRQRTCPFGGAATISANLILAAWPAGSAAPETAGAWATKLGVEPPYVRYNEVKPEPGGPVVAVLADGTWKDLGRPKTGASLRVYADGRAPAAALLTAIQANLWPGLRRVYFYGERDASFRVLAVPAPQGAIGVIAPAPPPNRAPLDIPAVPPGVPVVLGLAPGATVATVLELAQRVGERDVVLAGF